MREEEGRKRQRKQEKEENGRTMKEKKKLSENFLQLPSLVYLIATNLLQHINTAHVHLVHWLKRF